MGSSRTARGACAAVASPDLSIVGHDDMPLVDMIESPLTTVRIGHVAMGSRYTQPQN
jgi:DNA-binding LacI/PurR family transcriptional regulator